MTPNGEGAILVLLGALLLVLTPWLAREQADLMEALGLHLADRRGDLIRWLYIIVSIGLLLGGLFLILVA